MCAGTRSGWVGGGGAVTLLPEALSRALFGSADPPALLVGSLLGATLVATGVFANTAVVVWGKRKIFAAFWEKIGPDRIGPMGVGIIIADAVRLISKELIVPERVDRPAWDLAPLVFAASALLGFAVIPMGTVAGVTIQLADPAVGIAFAFAVSSISTVAIAMAGYASANKYAMLGSLRAIAATIAYEIPLLLVGLSVVLMAGTLQTSGIVAGQQSTLVAVGPLAVPGWYGILNPLAFLLFLGAMLAEVGRNPFDIPEAPQEIIAGYQTEYGSVYFALLYVAEFLHVFLGGAIAATLFLGGPTGPVLPGVVWFVLKVWGFFLFTQWARASVPRVRIDQLLEGGWKYLLGLAVLNLLLTAVGVGVTA